MKIATKTIYNNIINNMSRTSSEMISANETVSTGRKINKISDDPRGLVEILGLRSSIANLDQMESNIATGKLWLEIGESSLTEIEELLSQAKSLCIEMKDGDLSDLERSNAVDSADTLLRQILSIANNKVDENYMFAGTKTDTKPFNLDDEENPTLVTYSGNEVPFSIKIGQESTLEVGRNGEEIFGENWDDDNVFKTLIDLKTYIENNNQDGIEESYNKIENHIETVIAVTHDIAVKMSRLEVKENIIKDLSITYDEKRAQIEDVDITEAVVELKNKEFAYQVALSSSVSVMELSLVNYL